MDAQGKSVHAFYRKIVIWSLVVHVLSAVTIWAFTWGTISLVLRLTTSISYEMLLWGSLGFPIVAAWSAWLAKLRFPDPVAVRAYLDDLTGCGGMLMAGADHELARWNFALPKSLPHFRWNGSKPLTLLAFAASYLALCFLLPIEPRLLSASTRLDVSRETEKLGQQVKVLKEEKIIDSERAENLKNKLEQVRDQAAGKDPAKSLEALDHLNDMVRQAAHKAAESAAQEGASLGKLETAAEAMQQAAGGLDPADTATLMKDLANMAKKAADESESLKEGLDGDLAADIASGKLSTSSLAKLAAAARSANGKVKKRAKNLFNAKLIDFDQLKECEGECKCDPKALAEFLKKNGCKSLCDAMGNLAGRGGVNEGPGAADLQFGERSSEEGAKFQEEALPPGDLAALKESQTTGVSSTMPQRDKNASAPGGGSLRDAIAGGGSANAGLVLPQHKGAVGRYFDRPAK